VTLVRIVKPVEERSAPELRQTPGSLGIRQDIQFTFEAVPSCDYVVILNGAPAPFEVECPPEHVWSIVQEPATGPARRWHRNSPHSTLTFTSDSRRSGSAYVHSQPAVGWHVNRTYDSLVSCEPPQKQRQLSWITSDKRWLRGHRLRMKFLEKVRREITFDLFGAAFTPLEDKWDGLASYRYSLAIENHQDDYYWTEKIADCFLSWTMPIYYGCRRITDYFPADSLVQIDITKSDAIDRIKRVLADDPWQRSIDAIAEARERVLNRYQLFPLLANQIHQFESCRGSYPAKKRVLILPRKERRRLRDHFALGRGTK